MLRTTVEGTHAPLLGVDKFCGWFARQERQRCGCSVTRREFPAPLDRFGLRVQTANSTEIF